MILRSHIHTFAYPIECDSRVFYRKGHLQLYKVILVKVPQVADCDMQLIHHLVP